MEAKKLNADLLLDAGNELYKKGKWNQALESWEKALAISEELGDQQGISRTLNNIGSIYQARGEWDKALENYAKSLAISDELGDQQGISSALNNIVAIYRARGEWGKALGNYNKSLAISEELGDQQGISNTLINIGVIYQARGEWGKALENYNKSLAIKEELGDQQGISYTLNNIGEIKLKIGDLDEAKDYLERALAIAEKLAPISTVDMHANLSELQRLDDRYDDAFGALEDTSQIVIKVGAKPQEIDILEKLADTYLCKYIQYKEEENLSSAEKCYKDALTRARSMQMLLQEALALRGLGIIEAKKRNIPAARKSFKKALDILHSLAATFELQKTTLDYARALFENGHSDEAEILAKTAAFDALRNDYREPLMKAYLLLGDIAMKQENQYGYYLDALKAAEFNPQIYVKTCFFIIVRMKRMEKELLPEFTKSLKEINEDESFDKFLDAVNNKINGEEYDTAGLPSSLIEEIESFSV